VVVPHGSTSFHKSFEEYASESPVTPCVIAVDQFEDPRGRRRENRGKLSEVVKNLYPAIKGNPPGR